MSHPKDKQVRQQLLSRGAKSLSDAELISILLDEGGHGLSALEMGEGLLRELGKDIDPGGDALASMSDMDINRLRMTGGLGVKRAALLMSAIELGRRVSARNNTVSSFIESNEDVISIFRPMLASLPHEEFWVLYLNGANRVIDRVRISQGGVSATIVDHKLIIKRAIEHLSQAIIVVHNHPSGLANPSKEDVELTHRLQTAASLFEISLLDHIIITSGDSYSFRQHSLL